VEVVDTQGQVTAGMWFKFRFPLWARYYTQDENSNQWGWRVKLKFPISAQGLGPIWKSPVVTPVPLHLTLA